VFFCWIFAKSEKIPMKDEKIIDIEKLNNSIEPAADLPEVKRKEDGTIDIESIAIGKDEKGRYIIPDNIFDAYLKELPPGTGNASKTFRAYNGGKLAQLENNPEEASKRGKVGAPASNNAQATRRSIKEILEELSQKTVTAEEAEEYGLKEGTTLLEAANLAQIRRAMKGDTKAAEYVRDTLGEKPTDKISAEVTALTAEDKELINNISARLAAEKNC
jgi:hypothetical protein